MVSSDQEKDLQIQETSKAQEESASVEESLQELEEKYKRLAADFANYKKRVEAERARVKTEAEERCLKSVLTIYDDFLRMQDHNTQPEHLAEAVEAIQKKWQQWLRSRGLEIIDPEGQPFDHHWHDAVMHQPVDDPSLDGKVVRVLEYGYRRGNKVLRHAKVAVGRLREKAATEVVA